MRKLYFIIVVLTALAATSCEKASDSFVGTRWGINFRGEKKVLEFVDGENVRLYTGNDDWSIKGSVNSCRYNVSSGTVMFTAKKLYMFYIDNKDLSNYTYWFTNASVDGVNLIVESDCIWEYYDKTDKTWKETDAKSSSFCFFKL